jgi:hypothetical protein
MTTPEFFSFAHMNARKSPVASWNSAMETTFINTLGQEVRNGKRTQAGFKKESFLRVQAAVNTAHDEALEFGQIKNKYNMVRASGRAWWCQLTDAIADDEGLRYFHRSFEREWL